MLSSGATTVITTFIAHAFVPGNTVLLLVPFVWGMYQANGLVVTILSVTFDTITVDLDSSSFNLFSTPGTSPDMAQVVPNGDVNQGFLSPGGVEPKQQTVPGGFQAILT